MCWTELIRYAACGHHIRRTYLCPYQQGAYQSEPDYLTPCEMHLVLPADEDENGLCEKCETQGHEIGAISSAVSSAVSSAISSAISSATPSAPGVQDMIALAQATVSSETRESATTGGKMMTSVQNVMDKVRATVLS
jgi:hypothetical protein